MKTIGGAPVLLILTAVCSFPAQVPPAGPPDPLRSTFQQLYDAQREGRRADALTQLIKLKDLLSTADPEKPDFSFLAAQIAGQYHYRGLMLQAEQVFDAALRRASTLGDSHPAHLAVLNAKGLFLMADGQETKAARVFEHLISLAEKSSGDRSLLWTAYSSLARLSELMGSRKAGEALLVRQQALLSNPSPSDPSGRQLLNSVPRWPGIEDLAGMLVRQGRAAEAEKLLRSRAGDKPQGSPADTDEYFHAKQALSRFLQQQGRWKEALDAEREVYEHYKQSTKPEALGQAYRQLSTMIQISDQAGRLDESENFLVEMRQRADAIAVSGDKSIVLAATLHHAQWLLRHGRLEDADKIVQSYTPQGAVGPPWADEQVASIRAEILARRGDTEAAGKIRMDLQTRRGTADPNPAPSIVILLQRASSAVQADKPEEALSLVEQSLALQGRATDAPNSGFHYAAIGAQLAQKGHVQLADKLMLQVRSELERTAGSEPNALLEFLHTYVQYLFDRERWDEARQAIDDRRQRIVAAKGPDTPYMENVFLAQIDLVRRQGRPDEALPHALALLAHLERVHGSTSEHALRALENVAEVYSARSEHALALDFRRRALDVGAQVLPVADHRRAMLLSNLAMAEVREGQRDSAIQHLEQAVGLNLPNSDYYREQLKALREGATRELKREVAPGRWLNSDRFSRTDGTRIAVPLPKSEH